MSRFLRIFSKTHRNVDSNIVIRSNQEIPTYKPFYDYYKEQLVIFNSLNKKIRESSYNLKDDEVKKLKNELDTCKKKLVDSYDLVPTEINDKIEKYYTKSTNLLIEKSKPQSIFRKVFPKRGGKSRRSRRTRRTRQ